MFFEFTTANKIIFGSGTITRVAPLVKNMGSRAMIVLGKSINRVIPLLEQLKVFRIDYVTFNVPFEPTIELIDNALLKARANKIDIVIGCGGGSVLDAGKAISILYTNRGAVLDYLEVIGAGKKLTIPPLPYIAIPTTAGTGTEVTKNAVLLSSTDKVKVSLRHDQMIPDIAVIDPQLTYSMPPNITASTGLDALTQLIEPYTCNNTNPLVDGICQQGLKKVAQSLEKVCVDGTDEQAREDMCCASLFGGIALANAKLGAVHGFAGPIGGFINAPHGAICARLLPFVMETNINALKSREPQSIVLKRYQEISRILTGSNSSTVTDGVKWLKQLCLSLSVPSLAQYGLRNEMFDSLIEKARNASSMKGNSIKLTDQELHDILTNAL